MTRIALVSVVLAAAFGTGCATTTKIVSEPPGAQVFELGAKDDKEGKAVGKTPMSYEFKGWIWDAKQLKVSAPGYQPKNVEIKRSEINLVPAIGGVALFLCVPCAGWVGGPVWFLADGMKLSEETKVKLDREGAPAALRNEDGGPVVAVRY